MTKRNIKVLKLGYNIKTRLTSINPLMPRSDVTDLHNLPKRPTSTQIELERPTLDNHRLNEKIHYPVIEKVAVRTRLEICGAMAMNKRGNSAKRGERCHLALIVSGIISLIQRHWFRRDRLAASSRNARRMPVQPLLIFSLFRLWMNARDSPYETTERRDRSNDSTWVLVIVWRFSSLSFGGDFPHFFLAL